MTINAVVDERTKREIYLASFERAVKKGRPWTVMCSYNQIDGCYASENEQLLTKILRDEWGFEGIVVTDWGACNDRVAGLAAGQDLEMPSSGGMNDAKIVRAVKSNKLDIVVLDKAVERLLEFIFKSVENRKMDFHYDRDAHHALARRAAAESMVLLKNDGAILPLSKGKKLAVIGAFAKSPRYQGSGSSQINPWQIDTAWDELSKVTTDATYAAGYNLKTDAPDEDLIEEACAAAREADVALIFAGLPEIYESEGFDRDHMRMPESHNALILKVAEANPNTVVVLSNGAAVEMPWAGKVRAILEGFLGGQASGSAAVDVLFGKINPSGKLAETFAHRLEDHPSTRYFPAGPKTVEYRESLFVGYRYFDTAKKPVLFPFGFGLSYTTFEYSDLQLSSPVINDEEELKVSIRVKNTGPVAGSEVVQLYVRDVEATVFRPSKELKGFEKVALQPGEEKEVKFSLDKRAFAFYHTGIRDWHVESGSFEILVGASSQDIRARGEVWVESSRPDVRIPNMRRSMSIYYNPPNLNFEVPTQVFAELYGKDLPPNHKLPGEAYTINTPLGDLKDNFIGKKIYDKVMANLQNMIPVGDSEIGKKMVEKMMADLPLRNLVLFSNGQFSEQTVEALLLLMNRKPITGVIRLIASTLKKR